MVYNLPIYFEDLNKNLKIYSHEYKHDQIPSLGIYGEILTPISANYHDKYVDYKKDNYFYLGQRFLSEEKKKSEIFDNIENVNLKQIGLSTINIFVSNNISNMSFEFTFEKSILFVGDLFEYKIYLETFFNEQTQNSLQVEDAILNIYKDQKNVFCQAGDIYEIYRHIADFAINIKRRPSKYGVSDGSEYLSNIFNPTGSLQENLTPAGIY